MTSTPLPPDRPKARTLLDADAQQKVGDAPRVSSAKNRRGTSRGGTAQRSIGVADASPSSSPDSAGTSRRGARGFRRPRGTSVAGAPARTGERSVRLHSRPEPVKWSVGGLTISVRFLVGLAIVGVLLATLVPLGLQWMKQEQSYRAVLQEVATTQEENDAMRDQLAQWDNEDYVAAQARDRLGYVRPGETQYVVTDAPEVATGEETTTEKTAGPAKPWMWSLVENLQDVDNPPATSGLQNED